MKRIASPSRRRKLVEQIEHRRLNRDVEGARHLVADQHRRLGRERAGDGHPLALATRQLAGEA